MEPGVFTWSMGNVHCYVNQLDGVKEQLTRSPMKLPSLWINPDVRSLFDIKYDDIKLINYKSHPTIKLPVAV
jgi:thymidylate synthase